MTSDQALLLASTRERDGRGAWLENQEREMAKQRASLASSGRVRGRLYVQWRAARAGRIDITDNILIAASLPPGHSNTRSANSWSADAQKSFFSSKIHCVPFSCPLLLSYSVLKDRGRWAIGGGGAGPSILSTEKGKCNSIIERINPELFAHCSFSLVQTGRSFN